MIQKHEPEHSGYLTVLVPAAVNGTTIKRSMGIIK